MTHTESGSQIPQEVTITRNDFDTLEANGVVGKKRKIPDAVKVAIGSGLIAGGTLAAARGLLIPGITTALAGIHLEGVSARRLEQAASKTHQLYRRVTGK